MRSTDVCTGLFRVLSVGAAAPAPSPAIPACTSLARRRPHKRKVDLHGLVEQLRVVRAIDGRAGLFEGRVLDESVALES